MLPMVVRVLILPKYWTERKKSSFKCIAWVALELGVLEIPWVGKHVQS